MKYFTAHLDDVEETYLQHMAHALGFAASMVLGGLACLIHAIFPFLFVRTGSRCVQRLHDRMVVNRRKLSPRRRPRITSQTAVR